LTRDASGRTVDTVEIAVSISNVGRSAGG